MATFLPKRLTREEVTDLPISDGQFIIETDQGVNNKIYVDTETNRIAVGGGAGTEDPQFIGEVVINADENGKQAISMGRKADTTIGVGSSAMGNDAEAIGNYSHAEGQAISRGTGSHAEGNKTTASGAYSHSEGYSDNKVSVETISKNNDGIISDWNNDTYKFSLAKGGHSHAEGSNTLALNLYSHSEGYQTISSGGFSHSEGFKTIASGDGSHAEGYTNESIGIGSHAEGSNTKAVKNYSHSEGIGTTTSTEGQTVCGKYNIGNQNAMFIVGCGDDEDQRANGLEVLKNGNVHIMNDSVIDNDARIEGNIILGGEIQQEPKEWHDLLSISSDFNNTLFGLASSNEILYRKNGNTVEISLRVLTTGSGSSSSTNKILKLPSSLIPNKTLFFSGASGTSIYNTSKIFEIRGKDNFSTESKQGDIEINSSLSNGDKLAVYMIYNI